MANGEQHGALPQEIEALEARGDGHQFVFYGDACSGVERHPHEAGLARTNAGIERLSQAPEFVIFAGDEVAGLTSDEAQLREQWRYWLDVEMAWLDRSTVPLYNTTSNHTTYDAMSERVFAEVLSHLPKNGPSDQPGLSYFVRRGDLLLVFVNTNWSGLGGEGHVETEWLASTLEEHADAHFKLVIGHHPVFPVNGFSGEFQREVGTENGQLFWEILVRHRVNAYLCSHILAFDTQVHDGVLQIVSAGAATAHRMPPDIEYLHFVQAALDGQGLRYQVIDHAGAVRERLSWPFTLGASTSTSELGASEEGAEVLAWQFSGTTADDDEGRPQTLLSAVADTKALPSIWIGLTGVNQRLTVNLAPNPGRSPHYWFGPELTAGQDFHLQLAFHSGMGPGGVLWRPHDEAPWSSLTSYSPWGFERMSWPTGWSVGAIDQPTRSAEFRGRNLRVTHSTDEAQPVT